MSYKQSDYATHSTRSDLALQSGKVEGHGINSAERWLMAIAVTLLLLAYQSVEGKIIFSQEYSPRAESSSLLQKLHQSH